MSVATRVFAPVGQLLKMTGPMLTQVRSVSSMPKSEAGNPFDSRVAVPALIHRSSMSLMGEWAILRTMEIERLHHVSLAALDASTKPTVVGGVARLVLKPFMDQFCDLGEAGSVVRSVKDKGIDPQLVIFDYATEMIPDVSVRPATEVAYMDYLRHPDVKMIAVKLTGLCPPEFLENPSLNPQAVKDAASSLRRVVEEAARLGKIVVVDAEHYKAEWAITDIVFELAQHYSKTVMMTLQATRLDSISRLLVWLDRMPEGTSLQIKLVKGAYKSDRADFPDQFCQSFQETHQNYEALLKIGIEDSRVKMLPCSHNLDIIKRVAQSGFKEMGNLNGMNIVTGISPRLKEILYCIGHTDHHELVAYTKRRFIEHIDAFQPRRRLLIEAVLSSRFQDFISSVNK